VVIVRVVVTALALGMTELGLNVQRACAGNPLQEKLIAVVKEPLEATLSM
jgi:hypothetical protein